ncbi:MAG: hypothetical protein S4CHLAM6_06380 [Chlamydiae bacterium]|nr:hypothetical protein [Chlamydiota bacterium]
MKATNFFKSALFLALFVAMFGSADESPRFGVVNFATCIEKSYLGQHENAKLESLRGEMVAMLESKQKDFQEVAEKLNDPDFMEAINAEAEKELESKARALSEELQLMGNQTDQALQQAYSKMFQNVKKEIDNACEYIAREKNYEYIFNKESCFYFKRPTDITQLVIQELDRHYKPEAESLSQKGE